MGSSGLFGGIPGALAWHLGLSIVLGAGFGALVRFQAQTYAATLSAGLVLGLLWWIAGSLTAAPLLAGRAPTWSLGEASSRFGDLIGDLLYGALTGLAFHLLGAAAAARWPAAPAPGREVEPRTRLVVLGGGFAGVSAVQRLERLFVRDPGVDVTLVSPSNYLLFTPMLAEVASSALEARHISAPVRAACPRTRFRRAEVEAIDLGARTVTLRTAPGMAAAAIAYDHLVLALGAVPNYRGIPGLEEHAFTLKTLEDAERLRNHVISRLERADTEPDPDERRREVTFVVVGGGFAGVEMAAELLDLVRGVMRYYPGIPSGEPRFVLVHRGDRILPELSPTLGEYALTTLGARGIEFRLEESLERAGPGVVALGDGTEVPTRTLVWTAGNSPHALLGAAGLELGAGGGVVRVSVSGTQTSATKSAAPSWARTFASTLSVLTFAWAIALVCIGFEIVTLPACSASRSTIAHETDVDSSTTWSVGSSAAAKARRSLVSTRPTRRT